MALISHLLTGLWLTRKFIKILHRVYYIRRKYLKVYYDDVQSFQGLIIHTLPLLEEKMTGLMNTVAKSAITSISIIHALGMKPGTNFEVVIAKVAIYNTDGGSSRGLRSL